MKDIAYLVHRYLKQNASKQEIEELKRIIRASEQDASLKTLLDQSFNSELQKVGLGEKTSTTQRHGEELFKNIRARLEEEAVPVQAHSTQAIWWLAAAAVTTLFVIAIFGIANKRAMKENFIAIQADTIHRFNNKQFVELPDGSTVAMNDGSELIYYESYGTKLREVTLKGEAYFKVKPDALHAFVVRTGKVSTQVLGTEFNVNAYPGNTNVVITVTHGKVQVLDDLREIDVITPDQQLSFNIATHKFKKENIKAETALEWVGKFLILHHVSFEEAVKIISDKYKVKVRLSSDNLKQCGITATFLNEESLIDVLTVVGELHNTTYEINEDGSVTIYGKGCNDQ